MPRIRLEFSKGDPVRFLSHLDLMQAITRAVRRAGLPVALSAGFNPHPRLSFASALAVGVTSEREYLDIELKEEPDPQDLLSRLGRVLPPGINLKAGRVVPDHAPPLMAVVNRAVYQVTAAAEGPLKAGELGAKIAGFMGRTEIVITKNTKKGPRPKNIRPGIISLAGDVHGERVDFTLVTTAGNDGGVRPEEAVCALTEDAGLPIDCNSLYIRRISLYTEKNGKSINLMDFC